MIREFPRHRPRWEADFAAVADRPPAPSEMRGAYQSSEHAYSRECLAKDPAFLRKVSRSRLSRSQRAEKPLSTNLVPQRSQHAHERSGPAWRIPERFGLGPPR